MKSPISSVAANLRAPWPLEPAAPGNRQKRRPSFDYGSPNMYLTCLTGKPAPSGSTRTWKLSELLTRRVKADFVDDADDLQFSTRLQFRVTSRLLWNIRDLKLSSNSTRWLSECLRIFIETLPRAGGFTRLTSPAGL
jgi:hypothetical protein